MSCCILTETSVEYAGGVLKAVPRCSANKISAEYTPKVLKPVSSCTNRWIYR